MTTFAIDNENTILAFGPRQEIPPTAEGATPVEIFASETELASLAANWPANRLVEIWNGFAGVVPFDDLKPVNKFKDRASGGRPYLVGHSTSGRQRWATGGPRRARSRLLGQGGHLEEEGAPGPKGREQCQTHGCRHQEGR